MRRGEGLPLRSAGREAPATRQRDQPKTPQPGAKKKGTPPLLCASGRPDTQKNNSQLSGCDLNILTQDPGSIPAAYTFRKNSKNEK